MYQKNYRKIVSTVSNTNNFEGILHEYHTDKNIDNDTDVIIDKMVAEYELYKGIK